MGTLRLICYTKMKYIAAYLLASLNKQNPSAADVTKVLSAVGANVDDAQLSAVMGALDGQNVDALIEAGAEKFASVPSGGGAAPAAAVATPVPLAVPLLPMPAETTTTSPRL